MAKRARVQGESWCIESEQIKTIFTGPISHEKRSPKTQTRNDCSEAETKSAEIKCLRWGDGCQITSRAREIREA